MLSKKKIVALLLVLALTLTVVATSCNLTGGKGPSGTLVIGTSDFEEKFNPFFVENAYDMQVMDQIFVSVQKINADNTLIDWGGNISYEQVQAQDGHTQVKYTVKLKPGMKFTDGEPVTIDDVIFYYKVISDPGYDGPSSTFPLTVDIVGLKEYYYDDASYSEKIAQITKDVEAEYGADVISEKDFIDYLVATNLEGWWDGDPAGFVDTDYTWSDYIKDEGFGDELAKIDAKNAQAMLNLLAKVEYEKYASAYDPQTYYQNKAEKEYIKGNLDNGITVADISGITKVDDLTCTVLFDSVDIYGDRNVNAILVPEHYYGKDFKKGDVSSIKANMGSPIGSGPFKWVSFADNIATCTANKDYFEGTPKLEFVKWQYVPDADIMTALASGEIDIANPSADKELIETIDKNQNLAYDLMDNNGYGYLAINSKNVTDVNVRRGLLSLMNRGPSVKGYYGNIADVIERPMTTTLAEYPDGATVKYPYDPAKALEFFKQGGYTQKDGKLVNASGKQLSVNVYIGGEGIGDHPGYAMLTQAAADLKDLGGELIIQDVQFSVLQAAMNDGSADMFVLAWGESNTCDQSTIYMTNGGQNRTGISNKDLDKLLTEIPKTIDLAERKAKVAQALDIVMDEAVELPLYQRKNMLVYNVAAVDQTTLPETSTYWTYEKVLWKVAMKPVTDASTPSAKDTSASAADTSSSFETDTSAG